MGDPTRRAVVTGLTTATALGLVGTAGASESDREHTKSIDGTDHGGSDLQVTVRNDGTDAWSGALIESIDGFGRGTLVRDLHTILWDEKRGKTRNVRDDASSGTITESEYSPYAPELQLRNRIPFASEDHDDYVATVTQDVLVAKDRPAVLSRSFLNMHQPPQANSGRPEPSPATETNNTFYTVVNPTLDDSELVGSYYEGAEYDFLTVETDDVAGAIAFEHRDWGADEIVHTRRFDGQRLGHVDVAEGPDRSAWHDIYTESDGWIDANTENAGDLDAGFGYFVGKDAVARWSVCIGFGETGEKARTAARETIDSGYKVERAAYTNP